MGDFSQVLGGLLGGYGDGLAKQAEVDQQNQHDDALTRRQLALTQAQSDATTKREFALHAFDADRKDLSTQKEIGWRADAQKYTDQNKSNLTMKEYEAKSALDWETKAKELGLTFSHEEKMVGVKATSDIHVYNSTTGLNNPVTHTEIDKDGNWVGVTQDGTKAINLAPGHKFNPKTTMNDMMAVMLGAKPGDQGDGGTPAPAPTPSPTRQGLPTIGTGSSGDAASSQKTLTPQQVTNYYAEASAKAMNGDPQWQANGKPLNAAQIKAKVQQALTGAGYTLPPGI